MHLSTAPSIRWPHVDVSLLTDAMKADMHRAIPSQIRGQAISDSCLGEPYGRVTLVFTAKPSDLKNLAAEVIAWFDTHPELLMS